MHTKTPPPIPRPVGIARRDGATIVPLDAVPRRFRRDIEADAPRGQILLFTGVRYERMAAEEVPALPRRRRS